MSELERACEGQRHVFAPLRLRSGALTGTEVRRLVRADAPPRGAPRQPPVLPRKQGRDPRIGRRPPTRQLRAGRPAHCLQELC